MRYSRAIKATPHGRPNPVSRLPAAIVVTIGLIETYAIANAGLAVVARGAIVTTDSHAARHA